MEGVGHGTELAERYRLEERLLTTSTWQFWRAVDTTLERSVGLMVLDPSTAEDALDAARRSALVEDPRLLRVLDAGGEDVHGHPASYIVCEYVDGLSMETLLLQAGTLGADTVRAMVGETAQALAHAAENGLHHGRLRPSSVLRTSDGSVKVAGLAIESAAEGTVPSDADARADARALVALVYAGLTGRWPLAEDQPTASGLEPAPVVSGVPVPPADLVSGVPNDLDTLCSVTFGPHDDGPRTPAEVAEELRPWAGQGGGLPAAGTPGGHDQDDARSTARAMRPPARFPVRLGAGAASVGAAHAADATPADVTPEVAAQAAGGGSTERFDPFRDDETHDPAASTDTDATGPTGAAGAAGTAGAVTTPEPFDQEATSGRDDLDDDQDEDPFAERETVLAERGPRRDPRLVAGLVAGAVALVVLLWLAIGALTGDDGQQVADPTTEPTATGETSAPPSGEPAATTPPAATIQLAGAAALDPGGDGSENDETAASAIDTDPSTFWRSETYNNAAFGGLKDGLGMAVTLSEPTTVSGATLVVNGTGGTVELRTAPGPDFEGSTVVASAPVTDEPVELTLEAPVETQYLVVWFTELPEVGGEFRIELAQVDVR